MNQQLSQTKSTTDNYLQHFNKDLVLCLSDQLRQTLKRVTDNAIAHQLSMIAKSFLDLFHAYSLASSEAANILGRDDLDLIELDKCLAKCRRAIENLLDFNSKVLSQMDDSFIESNMPVLKEALLNKIDYGLIERMENLKIYFEQNAYSCIYGIEETQKILNPESIAHTLFENTYEHPFYSYGLFDSKISATNNNMDNQQNSYIFLCTDSKMTNNNGETFVDESVKISISAQGNSESFMNSNNLQNITSQSTFKNFDNNQATQNYVSSTNSSPSFDNSTRSSSDDNCKKRPQKDKKIIPAQISNKKKKPARTPRDNDFKKMFGHINCNVHDYLSTARYCNSVRSYGRIKKSSRKQMYNALHYEKVIRVDRIVKKYNLTTKAEKRAALVRSLLEILHYNLTKLGRVSMLPRQYSKEHEKTRNPDSFTKRKENVENQSQFINSKGEMKTGLCTMVKALDINYDDAVFLQSLVENMLQPFTFKEISEELQATNASVILRNAKKAFIYKKEYIHTASRKALTAILKIEKNQALVAEIYTALSQLSGEESESESESEPNSPETTPETQSKVIYSLSEVSISHDLPENEKHTDIVPQTTHEKSLDINKHQANHSSQMLNPETIGLDFFNLEDQSFFFFEPAKKNSLPDSLEEFSSQAIENINSPQLDQENSLWLP
jgi:hypothetical protein